MDRVVSYIGNKYGVRDVHNLLLPLLELFNDHCRRYQIDYSLAYGTLLGCVRNQGFIPWDDDVDVVMTHSNFEKFLNTLGKKETELSKTCIVECPRFLYKLKWSNTDNIPVFVDVFIADNVPNNFIAEKTKYYLVLLVKQLIIGRLKTIKKRTTMMYIRTVLSFIMSFPVSVDRLKTIYFKLCAWGNSHTTNRICSYSTTMAGYGRYHPSGILDNYHSHIFEDIQLQIMAGYDIYLKKEYGNNYMIPPTEENRCPSHTFILNNRSK